MARSYWSPADDSGFPGRDGRGGEPGKRESRSFPRYDDDYAASGPLGAFGPDGRDRGYRSGLRRRTELRRDWREWGDEVPGARPPRRTRGVREGEPGDTIRGYEEWLPDAGPTHAWSPERSRRGGGRMHPGGALRSGPPRPAGPRQPPPDYQRYLSRDEYGLPDEESYRREVVDPERPSGGRWLDATRGGPHPPARRPGPRHRPGYRNALFGGEGFKRYSADYDEQWW